MKILFKYPNFTKYLNTIFKHRRKLVENIGGTAK